MSEALTVPQEAELSALAALNNATRDTELVDLAYTWYPLAGAGITRLARHLHQPPARVAEVLAVFSPRLSVSRALRLGALYLHTGDTGPVIRSTRVALQVYEDTGIIRGPKTRSFAQALLGDQDAVVLDVWVARALGIRQAHLTGARYWTVAAALRSAASAHNMPPREAQALLWAWAYNQDQGRNTRGRPIGAPHMFDPGFWSWLQEACPV